MYLDPEHRTTMLQELRAIARKLSLSNLSKLLLFAQALNEQQQGKNIARAKARAKRLPRTLKEDQGPSYES